MSKLDRGRPFTQVYGLAEDGAHYRQDDKPFDHQDNEIKPKAEAKPKQKKAKAPATSASSANGDFGNMNIPQLQKALKKKTGKGARPGTPREEIIARLRA